MREHTLGDSIAGLNLRGTCEETNTGQSDIPGDRGKSSNYSFWMRGIMWLRFWMSHPGLTLDSFEDVLDRELQRSEAVVHLASSK